MCRGTLFVALLAIVAAVAVDASFASSGQLKLMNAAVTISSGPGEPVAPVVIDLSQFNCGPNYSTFPPVATDSVAPSVPPTTTTQATTTIPTTTSAVPSEEPTTDVVPSDTTVTDTPATDIIPTTDETTTTSASTSSPTTATQAQGTTLPASNAPDGSAGTPTTTVATTTKGPSSSHFSTSFSTKFTVPVGSPIRVTFPPVTGLLSAPCAMECVLSMPIETFTKSSDAFVDTVTTCLNKKYQVQVTLNSFTAGSSIVVFTVNGYAPSSMAIRDAIIAEKEQPDSDLATVFGMQSVSLVNLIALTNSPAAKDVPVGAAPVPGQDSPTVGSSSSSSQSATTSKTNTNLVGISIGAGVAGGIIVMLIGFVIMKRRNIAATFASSPEAQLRDMKKEVNGANLNQLRTLGEKAQFIFRSSCTCENTGACGVCSAYKAFLHDCSWCRTEFVVTELTGIIGRARGPDVTAIPQSMVQRVEDISTQCGCHFGREWSEPAAGECPHEALVAEFCEVVRVQNLTSETNRPHDHSIQLPF